MQSIIWQLVPTPAQVGGTQDMRTHNTMPHCTLYTFGGVSASWQLISPPRCPNPPNRSSEPVCCRGLLPRPPLSWREDKPRPHRAPHPMSLATVLLLTRPPSLGKPAWIHHMGRKVKKEVYTKSLSGSMLSCSSRFFIFGFWPCHVSQLPNYYTESGMDRSDICCWKWISHEECWCSRGRIIGKVNARWLMVLTDLLALKIHCSSRFESISSCFEFIYIQVRVYSLQSLATTQVMHIHNDLCTCPLYFNAITLTDTCIHCIFRNSLNLSSYEEYGPNIWWNTYKERSKEGSKCLIRLTYNCAHLRWTIESLTVKFGKKECAKSS